MDGRHRLYGDLAHLWPLMSPPDHYKDEARYWLRELRSRLAPGKRRILDLGTGGGHHLHQLTAEFDATAVDRVDYPVSKDSRPMYLWVGRLVGGMVVSSARSSCAGSEVDREISQGIDPRLPVQIVNCQLWTAGGLRTLSHESQQTC